jgi:hypothetical protein
MNFPREFLRSTTLGTALAARPVPVALIKDGWNEVVMKSSGQPALTIVGIELAVKAGAMPTPAVA